MITSGESTDALCRWLARARDRRDLTLPVAAGMRYHDPIEIAVRTFVAGLGAEMRQFQQLVAGTDAILSRNLEQLDAVAGNVTTQSTVIEECAASLAEVDAGAASVAATTRLLGDVIADVAAADDESNEQLAALGNRLYELATAMDGATLAIGSIDTSAQRIVAFLERLRRISRQTRMLGVNAAIEAAHIRDRGDGFAIVAAEVKSLGESTYQSARDVAAIAASLQEAGQNVGDSVRQAAASARSVLDDLSAALTVAAQRQAAREAFASAASDIATLVEQQSSSLGKIARGMEAAAQHAHAISDAAKRAERLDLEAERQRLGEMLASYTLDAAADVPVGATDLAGRADLTPELQQAAEALRARVDGDQAKILRAIVLFAVAVARNSYAWREIATELAALRDQLVAVNRSAEQLLAGTALITAGVERMRGALETLRVQYAASTDGLESSLRTAASITQTIGEAGNRVGMMSASAGDAQAIFDLIETISADTTLLALNAAIESAHAGEAGSAFGIIADEIRGLADLTYHSMGEIAGVFAEVSGSSTTVRRTIDEALALTDAFSRDVTTVQSTMAGLRQRLDDTQTRTTETTSVISQQLIALREMQGAASRAVEIVDADAMAATDTRRIDLAELGREAHALAARRPLGTVAEHIRAIGMLVAGQIDAVYDEAIASRTIQLADCYDTAYVEVTGERIAHLGRLFDVSRVPATGFSPPKFETVYDRFVDEGINAIIDASVGLHPAITAMFAVDLNGFCIGHYRACRMDWTGDPAIDLNANRIKRFFEDALSLRCARTGLGPAALNLPPRVPYATFRDMQCVLRRGTERPWAIYTYARDTGVVFNDCSVGIFANGQRVGAIRIIYDADAV